MSVAAVAGAAQAVGGVVNDVGDFLGIGGGFDPDTATMNERWFACKDEASERKARTLILAARQDSGITQMVEDSVAGIDFGPNPPENLAQRACYVTAQAANGESEAQAAIRQAEKVLQGGTADPSTARSSDDAPTGDAQGVLERLWGAIVQPGVDEIERRAQGAAAGAETGARTAGATGGLGIDLGTALLGVVGVGLIIVLARG